MLNKEAKFLIKLRMEESLAAGETFLEPTFLCPEQMNFGGRCTAGLPLLGRVAGHIISYHSSGFCSYQNQGHNLAGFSLAFYNNIGTILLFAAAARWKKAAGLGLRPGECQKV